MNPDARPRPPLPELPFGDAPVTGQPAGHQFHIAITDLPDGRRAPARDYWNWCPNCGSRLHNERCKRRCSRCHYFMSCADFD